MRALHVAPYFAPAYRYGGPPSSVLGLCQALGRAGVDVEVLTTTADGEGELAASGPGGDRVDGVAVRYLPRAFPRRFFGAAGLGAALRARAGASDVVHVHGLWHVPGWLAARIARRAGVPYVISPRGMLDPSALAHHGLRKRLTYAAVARRPLAGAALLMASSPPEAARLAALGLGVPVATVPNGVGEPGASAAARAALDRRLDLDPAAPLVVVLGRLHPIKRLDLVAAAFDRVRAARPDARLVVAGPDEGGHRRRVEPLFARAGAAVRFAGPLDREQVWALLGRAAVLVSCSDAESFGQSVLEAMAAGVPVVATRTVPWAELETHGAGRWVPQTAEALAEGVLDVLADPARARAMGERGRARAREAYSWDAVAERVRGHYEAVVAARPAPAGVA